MTAMIVVSGLSLLGIGLIMLGHRRLDRLEARRVVADAELVVRAAEWRAEHGWTKL